MAGVVLMGISMTNRMIREMHRLRGGNEKQRRRHNDYRPPHGKDAQFAVKSARISEAFLIRKVVYYHIMVDDGENGWEVQRRFADFADARDGMLINTDPNELNLNPSFPFPSKDMNNKNFHMSIPNQEKMEQRRLALEKWLNERIEMVRRKYDDPEWMEMNNLRHALYRMEAELAWLLGVENKGNSAKHSPSSKRTNKTDNEPPVVMAEGAVVTAEPVVAATPVTKEPTAPPQTA